MRKLRLHYSTTFEFSQDFWCGQIKAFASIINEGIKKLLEINSQTEEDPLEEISPGTFKLELFIKIKDIINEENVTEFTELIEKIKMINNKAKELYDIY
ncbi:hypothetical protein LCGC14_0975400 [marine sediment metagenome]|uniref:Uncharacterized protein n=1 Tax=marine sediment metagenome TaxID=412755 RepID=A0A0F9NAA6_9ZZZZ|nr:hypothetical protein [bacterium]